MNRETDETRDEATIKITPEQEPLVGEDKDPFPPSTYKKHQTKITFAIFGSIALLLIILFVAYKLSTGEDDVEFGGGTGSTDSPYKIKTCEQLQHINMHRTENFLLDTDLDCINHEFTSIGNLEDIYSGFSGSFNGNNKAIKNLKITSTSATKSPALFSSLYNATIQDLSLLNTQHTGGNTLSALSSLTLKSTLLNIHIQNTILNNTHPYTEDDPVSHLKQAGALTELSQNSIIQNCVLKNITFLNTENHTAGVLIALSENSLISNCEVDSMEKEFVFKKGGGFVGVMKNGEISNSKSAVKVLGDENVGGFIGEILGDANVSACESKGSVEGVFKVGGFVGSVGGESRFVECVSMVMVKGAEGEAGKAVGGFIGKKEGFAYYEGVRVSGDVIAPGSNEVGGFVGNSTGGEEFGTGEGALWDSEDVIVVTGGSQVGGLFGAMVRTDNTNLTDLTVHAKITSYGSDIGGMIGSLIADIHVENTTLSNLISNVTITTETENVTTIGGLIGIMGYVNLTLSSSNSTISAPTATDVGGLIGMGQSISLTESKSTSEEINSLKRAGGLIGFVSESEIDDCYSEASLLGDTEIGGLVGDVSNCNITNSYFVGDIVVELEEGTSGGIVGRGSFLDEQGVWSSYWDNSTWSGESQYGEGRSPEHMVLQDTYIDWDFENIWQIQEQQYPNLKRLQQE